jgi:hypothetical protein
MSTAYLYFAFCPNKHRTPIQLATPPISGAAPESLQTDSDVVFVVCSRCTLVYEYPTNELQPIPKALGEDQ